MSIPAPIAVTGSTGRLGGRIARLLPTRSSPCGWWYATRPARRICPVETHIGSIFAKLELAPAAEDHRRVLAVLELLRA